MLYKSEENKVWSLKNLENACFLGWLILEVIQNYFSTLFVKIFSWENVYFIENLNFYWLYSISGLAFVSPKVDFTNGGFFLVWVMWKDLSAQPTLLAYHFFYNQYQPSAGEWMREWFTYRETSHWKKCVIYLTRLGATGCPRVNWLGLFASAFKLNMLS